MCLQSYASNQIKESINLEYAQQEMQQHLGESGHWTYTYIALKYQEIYNRENLSGSYLIEYERISCWVK